MPPGHPSTELCGSIPCLVFHSCAHRIASFSPDCLRGVEAAIKWAISPKPFIEEDSKSKMTEIYSGSCMKSPSAYPEHSGVSSTAWWKIPMKIRIRSAQPLLSTALLASPETFQRKISMIENLLLSITEIPVRIKSLGIRLYFSAW